MSWLTDWLRWDTTPYPLEGETIDQCRRRLGLAVNQNPELRPGTVRPPAPAAPPKVPESEAWEKERQRLIKSLGLAIQRQNAAQRANRRLVRGAKALRAKWPKIYKEFFPFEVKE